MFEPEIIYAAIANTRIQRAGNKKKDPDRGRELRNLQQYNILFLMNKKKDPDRGREPIVSTLVYSCLRIKRKTPTGDENIITFNPYVNYDSE